ncbi:MAG: AraC family transcriptional regulator [Burkholderiaceae bacterium]|nr:AraC family transcriptional regulator [Burkholderiaceae bacterium]
MAPSTQLYLWRGASFVIGPAIDSRLHSHFALQLSAGLDGSFRARLSGTDEWQETHAAMFAPNQTHQIDGEAVLAHLFLEIPWRSETLASAVRAAYGESPAFAEARALLVRLASRKEADVDLAAQAARTWRDAALIAPEAPRALFDTRIKTALDAMTADPAIDGAGLAQLTHLSPSRFTHLFRQQTGMSVSRYLLWSRLLAAIEAVAHGASTTAAAHQAGFADLAHMSRNFSGTFGVVPSELQKMTIAFKREAL